MKNNKILIWLFAVPIITLTIVYLIFSVANKGFSFFIWSEGGSIAYGIFNTVYIVIYSLIIFCNWDELPDLD